MELTIKTRYLLFIGIAAALALRLFNLNYEGLWNDEMLTAIVSTPEHSIRNIVGLLSKDVHPPLHPILTNVFVKIFGYNDTTVRLINVLFGVWGVYAGYLLAKELFNKKVALYALGLLVLNSFLIRYSQEARAYAQLSVLANFSFLYFARLIKNDFKIKYALYYVAATAAMLYTHYFALFVVASQFVAFFFLMNWKRFKTKWLSYTIAFATPNILFLYWIQFILQRAERPFQSWRDPASLGVILEYLEIFFNDVILMYLAILVLCLSVLYLALRKLVQTNWLMEFDKNALFGVAILMIWLLVYFGIPYVRSKYDTSMMVNRYFVPLVVPVVILMAFYLSRIPKTVVRNGIFVVLCGYSVYVLFFNVNPYYGQTNTWRETVDHLEELDKDPFVWYLSKDRRYWSYYLLQKDMRKTRKRLKPFEQMMENNEYPKTYYVLTHLRAVVPKYKDSIPVLEGYEEVYSKDFINKNKIPDTRLIKYRKIAEASDTR